MDEDLKQHLHDMKRDLLAHTDAMGERLLAHTHGMEERLLAHTGAMEARLLAHSDAVEARLTGKIDRAAQSFAVDIGHNHSEIRAILDRLKKIDANVTNGVEMLVRQSRWHDETDTKALELLVRVNELERRLHDLESGAGK